MARLKVVMYTTCLKNIFLGRESESWNFEKQKFKISGWKKFESLKYLVAGYASLKTWYFLVTMLSYPHYIQWNQALLCIITCVFFCKLKTIDNFLDTPCCFGFLFPKTSVISESNSCFQNYMFTHKHVGKILL